MSVAMKDGVRIDYLITHTDRTAHERTGTNLFM